MIEATVQIDESLIPEGYRFVRLGRPKKGELWVLGGSVSRASSDWRRDFSIIVEKEPAWRDATVDDAIRVIRGETVECRVRDQDDHDWHIGQLRGFVRGPSLTWVTSGTIAWRMCQVRDE